MVSRRIATLALSISLLSATMKAATVPRPSPDFTFFNSDRALHHLANSKGKVIVLAFILTYCKHCQNTVAILSRLQKELGPRGLQVVAVATEDTAAMAVGDFIKQFQPPFPVGFQVRDPVSAYLQHPQDLVMMMPQLVLIDRTFTIREQHPGEDGFAQDEKNIRAAVESLLKENGEPKKTARAQK